MQQRVVDAFGKETVAALLDGSRVPAESSPATSIRFG